MQPLADQKNWQSQRGFRGLCKVSLRSLQGFRAVAWPIQSQPVFWACTKDWPRPIQSFRGFIGLRSPSGVILITDWFPSCGDLSVIDQWCGGDRSALHRRLVVDQLQSGCKACADHSPFGLQHVSIYKKTCLRITASFCHKYSQKSHQRIFIISIISKHHYGP